MIPVHHKTGLLDDFNAPFHGSRKDLSTYDKTKQSRELRALYREMFGAPEQDMEWLPEIPTDIEFQKPIQAVAEKGDTLLKGWPIPKKQAEKMQIDLANYQMTLEIAKGVNLKLIKIPAGKFIMGSTRQADELPQTVVEIEKPFWIGQFEITNRQFRAFDPSHDSRDEHRHGYQFGRKGYSMNGDDQPAVRISWKQAMDFCNWLSQRQNAASHYRMKRNGNGPAVPEATPTTGLGARAKTFLLMPIWEIYV